MDLRYFILAGLSAASLVSCFEEDTQTTETEKEIIDERFIAPKDVAEPPSSAKRTSKGVFYKVLKR